MKQIALYLLAIVLNATASAQEREGIAVNGGVPIYYRTYGTGTPLLIINGGPGMNSIGYETLAKGLAASAQTIIFDQRGTGQSMPEQIDSTTITMELMAQDIECLRTKLHIDKWVVLGQSFGGMLAAYYTSLHPERVSGLILSASGGLDLTILRDLNKRRNARLNKQDRDSLKYWNTRISKGDTSIAALAGVGRACASAYVYHQAYKPIIAERLIHVNNKINSLVWNDMKRIHFNCKPKLSTFNAPVLIIQGKEDIINPEIALTATQTIPKAQLVLMDSCGHWGWLERPDVYYPTIRKFVAETGKTKDAEHSSDLTED